MRLEGQGQGWEATVWTWEAAIVLEDHVALSFTGTLKCLDF